MVLPVNASSSLVLETSRIWKLHHQVSNMLQREMSLYGLSQTDNSLKMLKRLDGIFVMRTLGITWRGSRIVPGIIILSGKPSYVESQ